MSSQFSDLFEKYDRVICHVKILVYQLNLIPDEILKGGNEEHIAFAIVDAVCDNQNKLQIDLSAKKRNFRKVVDMVLARLAMATESGEVVWRGSVQDYVQDVMYIFVEVYEQNSLILALIPAKK